MSGGDNQDIRLVYYVSVIYSTAWRLDTKKKQLHWPQGKTTVVLSLGILHHSRMTLETISFITSMLVKKKRYITLYGVNSGSCWALLVYKVEYKVVIDLGKLYFEVLGWFYYQEYCSNCVGTRFTEAQKHVDCTYLRLLHCLIHTCKIHQKYLKLVMGIPTYWGLHTCSIVTVSLTNITLNHLSTTTWIHGKCTKPYTKLPTCTFWRICCIEGSKKTLPHVYMTYRVLSEL